MDERDDFELKQLEERIVKDIAVDNWIDAAQNWMEVTDERIAAIEESIRTLENKCH